MLFCHIKISRFRFEKTVVEEVPNAGTYAEKAGRNRFGMFERNSIPTILGESIVVSWAEKNIVPCYIFFTVQMGCWVWIDFFRQSAMDCFFDLQEKKT